MHRIPLLHSIFSGRLGLFGSGAVEIKPELAKWEGHIVTVSNVRDELWVALEIGAKEAC